MPTPEDHPRLLPGLLAARAGADPGRVALRTDGGPSITYADWDQRSSALARGLLALGIQRGDRVGLYFGETDWADYAVGYLGTVKAAAVAVPLSSRFPETQVHEILARAGVSELVTGRAGAPTALRQHTVAQLTAGQLTTPFQAPASPADVIEVLYTSGTTGLPKGVACTHAHAAGPLDPAGGWPPEFWRRCAGGTYLHANALSTAAGQLRILDALGPERMTVSALPVFDPERLCRLAAEQQAVVIQLVPGMATAILEAGSARRHDLSCVRVLSLGCAAFPASLIPRLAAAFPAARLVNLYELSEARHTGTAMVHDGVTRLASVGLPRGRTEVRITDERGCAVPAGQTGEIRLRWPGLPPQYYHADPAASSAVFTDGWTRTGDAGYLDSDGYLFITDRIKDVIIKGGTNIPSVVVESALLTHPAVAEAAVFGVPDALHGELIYAAVVLRSPVSTDELRGHTAGRLARQEVPDRILPVTELPRNRSGKVLKSELRGRFGRGCAAPQPGGTVAALAGIWADVLGRDHIGADDDFLMLGGDSLRASRVAARLREAYGIELPVADIFEHPRLADLAAVVGQIARVGPAAADGPIPLLARQPGQAGSHATRGRP
jgi:acyl-CoA synthetase (AMP-forming)/AMP-acid ligase II/acyl carrier protein